MPKLKTPLLIVMILAGLVAGFLLSQNLRRDESRAPVLFRLSEIRKVRQLKLVTFHFEEIIPIEKNGKIKLLLIVPATVSGYVNLDALQFKLSNDTLISLVLPKASFDSAVFQIEKAVNYDLEKKFSISLGTGLYQEVFQELQEKLRFSKAKVTAKAVEMGLESATESAAKEYLGVLLSDLHYAVNFKDPGLFHNPD